MKLTDAVVAGVKESAGHLLPLFLLAVLAAAGSWLLPAGPWRQLPVFTLLWLCPGLAWFTLLPGSRLGRLLSGCGLGILINVMLALVLHMLAGPLPRWMLLSTATVSALLPLLLAFGSYKGGQIGSRDETSERSASLENRYLFPALMLLLLTLTVALRLPDLEYREFQGDEGLIMERAAAALLGDDAELFLHQKGPVEILIPLFTWGLSGSINEFWARLPFATAGILAVFALFVLARAWLGQSPAVLAAVLFSMNGFAVAFSRVVQYQSLVMLWTVLAILHAVYFRRQGQRSHLALSAAFLAAGLLAHYDALMVAPVVAWLVVARIKETRRVPWRTLAIAAAIGAVLLAIFYLPFAASPTFASTGRYLLGNRLGGELISWSGPDAWRMATLYNSTYYVAGLLLLALVAVWALRRHRSYVALIAYALIPLLFYTGAVADPRTHIYTIFPGAAILAAGGAHALWQTASGRLPRTAAATLLLLFLAISAAYVYLMFTDVSVERQRNWETARPSLYHTTWQEPPLYGLFGFPYQSGWRMAATLVHDWPYASNEEQEVTGWYMGQAPRTHCGDFETFLLADNVQDPVPYDEEALAELDLRHVITVNGQETLRVYQRQAGPTERWRADERTLWRTPQRVFPPTWRGDHPTDVILGGRARLLGYDLDVENAVPGGELTVVLYWRALEPFERNFQTFVHLYDGKLRAQHDSAPDCAVYPTTRWEPGRVVRDAHVVQLPADIPTDQPIPLYVGMYDLLTEQRLRQDGSNEDTVYLRDVTVREP